MIVYCKPSGQILKEFFCKIQKFFCDFSQQHQGGEEDGADPEQKGGQKLGAGLAPGAEGQEIQHRPQSQEQGHEQAQTALPRHDPQEEEYQGGQKAEQQVQGQPELIQPQPPPQGGGEVVHQAQPGAAGQGDQGLQPLLSGVQTHQPSSLPNHPLRPGAFSA